MGEWIKDTYFGDCLACPVCKKTFVAQYKQSYYTVHCKCSWCGHKWESNSVIYDDGNGVKYPKTQE